MTALRENLTREQLLEKAKGPSREAMRLLP
jgi:hypothetical protein